MYIFTPTKILDEPADESIIIQIRSSALTLLAVLSSHHEDIKKRIAEQESMIFNNRMSRDKELSFKYSV
jgi:hypothetical protein